MTDHLALGHKDTPTTIEQLALSKVDIKCLVLRTPFLLFYLIPSPARNKGELLLVVTLDSKVAYYHPSCYLARSHFLKLSRVDSLLPNPPDCIRARAVELAKEFLK